MRRASGRATSAGFTWLSSARLTALLTLAAVAVAACTTAPPEAGAADDSSTPGAAAGSIPPVPPADESPAVALPQVEASPVEPGSSAFDRPLPDDLPEPLVPPRELTSGGPPPDGIPAIDSPRFIRATDVVSLVGTEPVLSLEVDGEARAYPVRILIWHEIVNDTLAGVPVAVTYCPLCNSALAFDRRVDDRVLSFGTSGLLYNSDLVMYDRQTESLWPQLEGRAVVGRLTGTQLERVPIQTVSWQDFAAAHPEAWVLSEDTGHDRDYGSNPYEGYDDEDTQPFLFDGEAPPSLPAKARVVGLGDDADAVAVSLDLLSAKSVVPVTAGGDDVVLLYAPGLTSALDEGTLADSKAVGATGAFLPVVGDRSLTFTASDEGFIDEETGSTWNILGQAVAGPLQGSKLTAVEHVDTFWFAWSAFQPRTDLLK